MSENARIFLYKLDKNICTFKHLNKMLILLTILNLNIAKIFFI